MLIQLKTFKNVLALDPSGNWLEGKGTTGICLYNTTNNEKTVNQLSAKDYTSSEAYWFAHLVFLDKTILTKNKKDWIVVIEDYLLYASRAKNQIQSRMETPKLIGIIQLWCYTHDVMYYLEPASVVKTRWTNDILLHKDIIQTGSNKGFTVNGAPLSRHCLDAIRHAVHYSTFINGKEDTPYANE